MQHHRPALSWCPRLKPRRGAAFLLSVYFTSLVLLVLGGVALQRTVLETRASQLSRDKAQSFYLAEAALDSALSRVKKERLLDGISYTVPTLQGTATFYLETILAEILAGASRQTLVRRIVATGESGNGTKGTLSAYFEETGPIEGMWGNGAVIAHGGMVPKDFFLTGHMRSRLGSIASEASSDTPYETRDSYWGIGIPWYGDGRPDLTLDGAAYAGNGLAFNQMISSELQSLKHGYKCFKGIACEGNPTLVVTEIGIQEYGSQFGGIAGIMTDYLFPDAHLYSFTQGAYGENHSKMRYDSPAGSLARPFQENIPHVTGAISIGAIQHEIQAPAAPTSLTDVELREGYTQLTPDTIVTDGKTTVYVPAPVDCSADLVLSDSLPLVISDNYDNNAGVKDLIPNDGKITLCVNAIVPDMDATWLNAVTNEPPGIVFSQPARIFVTGSRHFNLDRTDLFVSSGGRSVTAHAGLPYAGVQYEWDVSVGAKIHAPQGVRIEVTQPRPDGPPPGVVWAKPGREFSGSILAPQSMVVLRERAAEDIPVDEDGNVIPYQIQYVVGNEVVVELENDVVEFGKREGNQQSPQTTVRVLGWKDGS
jgi:hypothetical protein